jgi:shikimate kinase
MSAPLDEHILVVLTGPVGAGKSTTAAALAAHLRGLGLRTAHIDLDLIYCMARQRDGFGDEDIWKLARCGAAALADAFFRADARAVVVEGGFFTLGERDELVDCLSTDARVVAVTLQASFDCVARRVQADPDPGRVASRNPAILRKLHSEYVSARPYLTKNSAVVDTDDLSIGDVVDQIARFVVDGRT